MNLHGIVANAIQTVNPFIVASIQVSAGYTTESSGKRAPKYLPTKTGVSMQVQPLTTEDIKRIEGLNLQGTHKRIHVHGHVDGLVRVDNKGGDIITFSDGKVWLVAVVLEAWPDWTAVAVTLQNGS